MKFFKYAAPLVLGLLVMIGSAAAQGQQQMQTAQPDSITDQELQKFAEISNEAKKIQMEARQKVDSMLSEENMKMERFQQIMMSRQNPQTDSLNITQEEQQTIQRLQPKLMKMQQESQQKFVAAIQEHGLNPQRFQQIMQAVRTNPAVMQRFQNMMRDTVQN